MVTNGVGKTCMVDGCNYPHHSKGYCELHYGRHKRGTLVDAPILRGSRAPKTCTYDYCDRDRTDSGLCDAHANQMRLKGELRPLKPRSPNGWNVNAYGYMVRKVTIDGIPRVLFEHRVVMEDYIGRKLEPHENVHHVNGDRADNRLENLELWSTSQPAGQRVIDKLKWARELIALYEHDEDKL